ncbi:Uncharacterised protein [Escherichia coli]|nr:Uncharacterised protein [Escherichia coli]
MISKCRSLYPGLILGYVGIFPGCLVSYRPSCLQQTLDGFFSGELIAPSLCCSRIPGVDAWIARVSWKSVRHWNQQQHDGRAAEGTCSH